MRGGERGGLDSCDLYGCCCGHGVSFRFVSFRFVSFHINVCFFFFFLVRCLVSIYPVAGKRHNKSILINRKLDWYVELPFFFLFFGGDHSENRR